MAGQNGDTHFHYRHHVHQLDGCELHDLRPAGHDVRVWSVSRRVNRRRNNGAELLEAIG